jgi:hypothetical protein
MGIIARIIEMLRKSHCSNYSLYGLISQINLERIAHDYNLHPISGSRFGVFCKSYLPTRNISGWRAFFYSVEFNVVFQKNDKRKSGLYYYDSEKILQILRELFSDDSPGLAKRLANFDFHDIGKKGKGKDEKDLDILFGRLLALNLEDAQYRSFIDGFGPSECERLSHNGKLNKILRIISTPSSVPFHG